MNNKEVNPLLAIKIVDEAEKYILNVDDREVKDLTRAEISEIIHSMYASRSTGKLIFHFTGTGIVPELQIKGNAVVKLLTEKKV